MTSSCVFEEIMAHVKNWKKMAFPERLLSYDTLNRRIRQTDPTGNPTSFSYDANGNRTSTTDAAGKITSYA